MKRTISYKLVKYKSFFIFTILNLLFYGCYVIHHYSADTYLTEALVWRETIMQYFMNARWLMSCFAYICEVLKVSHTTAQLISWMVSIFSISLASTIIYHMLQEKITFKSNSRNSLLGISASFMLISNVFLVEYFIFAEYTGMICLGILCNVIGATFILKFIAQNKIQYYFLGIIFAILGINGHQGSFAIFVVICTLFSLDTFNNIRIFIKNNFIIGSAYLIPCLVNLWQSRIGGTSRVAHDFDIVTSFKLVSSDLINLLQTTANFMGYRVYALFIGIIIVYFLYQIIQKKAWHVFIPSFYCCFITILAIYAPLMMTDTNSIDVVPRTVFIMGAGIPLILLQMFLHLDINANRNILLPLIVVLFLCMQYLGLIKITSGTYQANTIDLYEAQYITNHLTRYEEQTGIAVTKIALYWDKYVTGYAPGVIGYNAVNERVMSNDWAAPLAIQVLTGYQIESTDKSNAVYAKYFEGKNWSVINDEQFVIIGDTLHLCAY